MSQQYELGGTPQMTTTTYYTNGEPPTSASAMTTSATYTPPSSTSTSSSTSDLSYDGNLPTPMPRSNGSNPYEDDRTSMASSTTRGMGGGMGSERSSSELSRVDTNSSIFSNGSVSDKRVKEWREAFDVEEDEELVDTHGSALAKEILVHGRIFISTKSVAFKSNILGFKTKLHFPLTKVVAVRPKMTALVIPNAIEIIQDDGTTSMFSTLPNRDATLEILITAWRQQAPEAHAAFEGRDRSSSVSSQPPPMNVNTNVGSDHGGSLTPVAGRDRSQSAATAPPAVGGGHAAPNNGGAAPTGAGGGAGGEDLAKTAQKIESHPATTADTPDFPELALDTKFPTTPEKVFNLMYNNEQFLKSIWDKEGFTDTVTGARGSDISLEPWAGTKRSFAYIKPLSGSVGPSSCECKFTDEIINQDAETWYGVITTTQTPGVPSGKSFKVMTKTTITWAGGKSGGCRVRATSNVEWTGRSMLKSVINSQSIAGQKTYNSELSKAVRAYIKAHPTEFAIPGQVPSSSGDAADDDDEEEHVETTTSTVQKTGNGGTSVQTDQKTETVKTGAGEGGGDMMGAALDWVMEDIVRTGLLALVVALVLYNLISFLRGGSSSPSAVPPPPPPPHYHVPTQQPPVVGGGGAGAFDTAEVKGVMERLQRLEQEWASVRQACVGMGVGGAGGGGGVAAVAGAAPVVANAAAGSAGHNVAGAVARERGF